MTAKPIPLKRDEAFGIVPIHRQPEGDRVLLIQHHAGHWGFPKGHPDPGETALTTAQREFEEETGITDYDLMSDRTFAEHYRFKRDGANIEKTVTYFAAWVHVTDVICQAQEIRSFTWLPFEDAAQRITYDPSRQVLRQVQDYLQTLEASDAESP